MEDLGLHDHRRARMHVRPARMPLQYSCGIVPALARQILAQLLGPEILMQANRHETQLIEEVVVDDHGGLDPIRLFFEVVRVMRQPASIDEEFAVAPHAMAQRFQPRAQNRVGAKLHEVLEGDEFLLAAVRDDDVAAA
jgi:hypothetical protein